MINFDLCLLLKKKYKCKILFKEYLLNQKWDWIYNLHQNANCN